MIVRSCNDSVNDASSVSNIAKQGSVTMIPNSTIDVIQSYLKKLSDLGYIHSRESEGRAVQHVGQTFAKLGITMIRRL